MLVNFCPRKCVGITAFEWWIVDNNAFSQRKQPQTLENIVFHYVGRPVNVGRHVIFKRYLRIYCPWKWKKMRCIRRKTSVKTMFCYWKTPINNKIQTVFPSLNSCFRRVNCEGKLLDNGTPIRWLDNNGKISENARIMPRFQIVTTCFPNGWTPFFFAVFSV